MMHTLRRMIVDSALRMPAAMITLGYGVTYTRFDEPAGCTTSTELSESDYFLKYMGAAGISDDKIADFERLSVGTVVQLMSYNGGRLNHDSPAPDVATDLLKALSDGNSVATWPNRAGSDDDKARYTAAGTSLVALCRFCKYGLSSAITREATALNLPEPKPSTTDADAVRRERDNAARKDAESRVARMQDTMLHFAAITGH